MNYRHVYMCIIAHAKKEMGLGLRPKNKKDKKNFPNQYFEFHHILPKSLFPNWTKRQSNLVALTAREHFFCHQLLIKIYPCGKMACALFKMMPNIAKYRSSKDYEKIRKQAALLLLGENSPFYGKHHTDEAKQKNAEWHKMHKYAKEIYDKIHEKNKGKKRTEETKKRMSDSMKAFYEDETEEERILRIEKTKQATREAMSKPEVRAKTLAGLNSIEAKAKMKAASAAYWADPENHKKHSEACIGRKLSEETKRKISETQKKRTPEEIAEIQQRIRNSRLKNQAYQEKLRLNAEKRKQQAAAAKKRKEERHKLALQHAEEYNNLRLEQAKDSKLKWWNNGIMNTRGEFPPDETWVRGKLKK